MGPPARPGLLKLLPLYLLSSCLCFIVLSLVIPLTHFLCCAPAHTHTHTQSECFYLKHQLTADSVLLPAGNNWLNCGSLSGPSSPPSIRVTSSSAAAPSPAPAKRFTHPDQSLTFTQAHPLRHVGGNWGRLGCVCVCVGVGVVGS